MGVFSFENLRAEARQKYGLSLSEDTQLRTASKTQASALRTFQKDPDSKAYDIFLSHSFQDRTSILGLKAKFDNMGFPTYVDWVCDPQLSRSSIGKATTEQLRMRMRNSFTLFYAFSSNSGGSNWMPWELGYVDGLKSRCAVLRVENDPNSPFSYRGFEYLEVYPYADEAPMKNTNNKMLWINESANRYVAFPDWKNGKPPFDH